MRILKFVGVLVVLAGAGLLAQSRWTVDSGTPGQQGNNRAFSILGGRGAEIGVSIRDAGTDDKTQAGVVVVEIQPDSAAEKAGLKSSDVIVEFDGEHVRSARQFSRLVAETPSGRTVKATVMRDGQKKDVEITPNEGKSAFAFNGDRMTIDGNQLRERLKDWNLDADRAPFTFDGNGGPFGMMQNERGRLGVAVEELTPQLGTYFGAKEGVLIASVSDDSPAARAGLKAGDVVIRINNEPVRSRDDVTRLVSGTKDGGDVTIVVVRDKKESTVTAKIEARRPARRGQPA